MPRAVAAVVALGALVLAAGGAARPQETIRLRIGDVVDVAGTKIVCVAINSSKKDGVACVLWAKGKPIVGTYGAGLAVDGTAVLNRLKADGSAQQIFKRRLSSAGARQTVRTVHVGDLFGFPIDNRISLGCRVLRIADAKLAAFYRGVRVSCWRATATAPLPHSYGIAISDRFAGVFAFDSAGVLAKDGVVRRQPG